MEHSPKPFREVARPSVPADDEQRLATLRTELDALNMQLLPLLAMRGRVAKEVIDIKRQLGRPKYDPEREAAMLLTVLDQAVGVYPATALASVYQAIFAAARTLGAQDCDDRVLAAR